ncbi:GTP-binding protein [Candidatus Gottesmanbacteria bacterium]|nr:GTP-binding protein [Candidatus Gottesmanbacteria bacterium]
MVKQNNQTLELRHAEIRPPIVAVLGHVDHGKTTLLDTIRASSLTEKEAGGITQHIGAYQIVTPRDKSKGKIKSITFIDTPGHEAFKKMRERGSQVADIAILVVSAADGVMPQTVESIEQIKKAGIPMIVAANKVDLPQADLVKVKQQLAKIGVMVEGFGGDTVIVPLSAKTGQGVKQLLEMIALVAELKEIPGSSEGELEGVVIESHLDKRRGILATVIVKNGTLTLGDIVYANASKAKVRAIHTDLGETVTQAVPSMPVEVMGWDKLPHVGTRLSRRPKDEERITQTKFIPKPFALPPLEETKKLKIVLKTDVYGTLEAITGNLGEGVEVVASGTGEITESDILFAKSTQALVIGFHVSANSGVLKLAETEKVKIKLFTIIYNLLDEIREVVKILQTPKDQEIVLGEAKILAEFNAGGDRVAGCRVLKGRIAKGDLVKLVRGQHEVGKARVKSLRSGKVDVPKSEKDEECGIVLDKKLDFKLSDLILSYKIHDLLA